MAKIVLGIATSHTPMLNTPAKDWPSFIDRDGVRDFLDKDGNPATYEELLTRADPRAAPELSPERFAARHDEAQAAIERLKESVRRAELDALIIVGDDQKELFYEDHLPSILVYYGDTIRNVPLSPNFKGPEWSRLATARYYEEKEPRDYPVDGALGAASDRRVDRPRVRHRLVERASTRARRRPRSRLRPQAADGRPRSAGRAGVSQHLLPAEPAHTTALLQTRPGDPRGGRELARRCPHRHCRLGRAQPFCRRRGARPRHHRRARAQGRRRRCSRCRAKSSIPAAPRSACGSRSAVPSSISTWRGRITSPATAPRRGPAPASASLSFHSDAMSIWIRTYL